MDIRRIQLNRLGEDSVDEIGHFWCTGWLQSLCFIQDSLLGQRPMADLNPVSQGSWDCIPHSVTPIPLEFCPFGNI